MALVAIDAVSTASDLPLPIHSLNELRLYLLLVNCSKCGKPGPAMIEDSIARHADHPSTGAVAATCRHCQHSDQVRFELVDGSASAAFALAEGRINGTPCQSHVLDVGQWLVLFRVLLESASRETHRQRARLLGYEAAQCLEEALKFYGEDNDLPPESACFTEGTVHRLRHHPQQFARSRLINLRTKLPSLTSMERKVAKDWQVVGPRKPWWKWW